MKKLLLKIYYKLLEVEEKITIFYNRNVVARKRAPKVLDTDKTLYTILNSKYSVSRFGDGEFALMYGESLKFQPQNTELSIRLKEILLSKECNHIVCIPNVFDNVDWWTEKAKVYWKNYLNKNRHKIYRLLNMNKIYYDTQVTRLYIDLKDKEKVKSRFDTIKLLWKDRELLIVEGKNSRLGVGDDLFKYSKEIERIICPAIDAFSKYDEILAEVVKHDKSKLVLIALGPTATVLAYDLAKLGYQAIDIGHIDIEYEWFLMGVTEKCPVKNKYIGEIRGGDMVEALVDETYRKQIVVDIK